MTTPTFPRPVVVEDVAFLYEGFERRKLRVQTCRRCGKLRHPPGPVCPFCQSPEWTATATSGRGWVHSFTVHHHPPIPPWSVPHAVVLADMEEGFRFLASTQGLAPDEVRIGMPVAVDFVECEPGFTLPVFRAAS